MSNVTYVDSEFGMQTGVMCLFLMPRVLTACGDYRYIRIGGNSTDAIPPAPPSPVLVQVLESS